MVEWRLARAGETLLAMRDRGPFPAGVRCAMPEVIRDAIESYGWTAVGYRPAIPDSAAISRMDLTYRWLALIPEHRRVVRRIVACRSLVSPTSGKHIIPWRRLGEICHADYRAVQRWHHQGIGLICSGLGGRVAADVWPVASRKREITDR